MPPVRSSRIGLTARMVIGFVAFAVVVGIVLALLLSSLESLRDVSLQSQRSERAVGLAFSAEKAVVDMETGLRGYLVSNQEPYLDPWFSGQIDAPRELAQLRAAVRLPAQQRRIETIQKQVQSYIRDFGMPLVSDARQGLSEREVLAANADDKRRVDQIRAGFQQFVAVGSAHIANLQKRATSAADDAATARIIGAVVLLALLLVASLLVTRRITRPLRRIADGARALSSGDLRTRVPPTGAGEVGEVGRAFNAMAESLQRTDAALRRLSDEHLALVEGVFAQTPVGLAFFDLDLRFARVNERLGELDDLPPADHIGRSVADVLPTELAITLLAQLHELQATGAAVSSPHEVALPGADQTRTFDITCYPVRAPDGTAVGYGAVVVETTSARQELRERETLLRQARSAARRTERLQAATATLAAAITPQEVLDAGLDQAVSAVRATAGAIALIERDGTLVVHASQGYPQDIVDHWTRLDATVHVPLVDAALTGRPVYLRSRAAVLAAYPDVAGRPSPHHAQATIPLVAQGRTLGAMLIAFEGDRDFPERDRALLRAIAEQCAVALDRARLFAREREIASTLQQSLLPPSLPTMPAFTLRARYLPTGEGYDVGGDFYDVIDIGDGACVLALGDVCGKGAEAAAVTGMARHTLHADVRHVQGPALLLSRLNDALLENSPDRFCTAAVALARPDGAGARFSYALAGHHAALLVPAGGAPRILPGRGGPVLGIVPELNAPEHVAHLQPGDVVILHTDGLLDAHAPERQLQQEELLVALAHGPQDVDALLERLIELALDGDGYARDDIAIVALRVD